MNKNILFFFLIIFVFASCKPEKKKIKRPKRNEIIIEKAEISFAENDFISNKTLKNLFDNDTSTVLETPKQTAPNEYFEFYFSKKEYIESVKLQIVNKTNFLKIKTISIYSGNEKLGTFRADKRIYLRKECKKLRFRIDKIERIKTLNFDDEKYNAKQIGFIEKNKSIAISEMELFGKKGIKQKVILPIYIKGNVFIDKNKPQKENWKLKKDKLIIALENQLPIDKIHIISKKGTKTKIEFSTNTDKIIIENNIQIQEFEKPLIGKTFYLKTFGNELIEIEKINLYTGNRKINFIYNKDKPLKNIYIESKIVKNILGKYLSNYIDKSDSMYVKTELFSIVLHQNSNFCFYKRYLHKKEREISAKGKWKIISQNKEKVIISLKGKYNRYEGENKIHDFVKFNDTLKINKDEIKSNFLFKNMRLKPYSGSFVNVKNISDKIVTDIRYATKNNFTKVKLYDCSTCLLRYEVLLDLLKAEKEFEKLGLYIKIFDAYRPLSVQKKMWKKFPNPIYVANPYKKGSIHNRGSAVDLTLIDKNGKELDMGTVFDFFGREAHRDYKNLPKEVLENRSVLRKIMENSNFRSIISEWWHFSHKKAYFYPVSDIKIPCKD